MKTAIIENTVVVPPRYGFMSDVAELVKARLTMLVLLTTAVGFYLGSESPIDYRALFHTGGGGRRSGRPLCRRQLDGRRMRPSALRAVPAPLR